MDAKATGQRIVLCRKDIGLFQAELAERLYVTDKAVSCWETGRGMPGLDSLEPLAEVLGILVSELLSGKRMTTEELPKVAGGQIMESMKQGWKLTWLARGLAAVLVAGTGLTIDLQRKETAQAAEREAHYTASADGEGWEELARKTAEYFAAWGQKACFDAGTLEVRDRTQIGDYMAILCSDNRGEWCMSLWKKDEVYPDRYQPVGGRITIKPGIDGLRIFSFHDGEDLIVVASGAELPGKARSYEWGSNASPHMERAGVGYLYFLRGRASAAAHASLKDIYGKYMV